MLRSLSKGKRNPWRWVRIADQIQVSASMDLSGAAAGETASFGFKQVPKDKKAEHVGDVFRSVASRYDVMNDVMSAGVHRLWKSAFVDRAVPFSGMKALDVAGGTGDIAFRLLHRLNQLDAEAGYDRETNSSVVVSDISPEMLEVGKKRASQLVHKEKLEWVAADAEDLPFDDASFDLYTVAFGVRNMTDKRKALLEAFRVLKPGGRFMCLEFSQVNNPVLSRLYDIYSFSVIPLLGRLVAADSSSYQYLVESIRDFPNQTDFAEMIGEAGFSHVTYENLTNGIVAIHSGVKL